MTARNAPAKLTGGQGFNFEDQVAASFLLGVLGAAHPLGTDTGRLTRLDWQARDDGWRLDDLALTFGAGDYERAAGVSIKNHKQVTESGFPEPFTRACWEQWLGVGTDRKFRVDRDLLILVTGALAEGVRTAWDTILAAAIETTAAPERLVERLRPGGGGGAGSLSSETQRQLFRSLHCPADLRAGTAADEVDEVATARLVRHIRLVHLDFESIPSRAAAHALTDCRTALADGTTDSAEALWDALLRIAARKRGRGGSIDLPELLSRLGGRFVLRGHPEYRGDWDELDRRSRERFGAIGLTVGDAAPLPRQSVRRKLFRHLRENRVCVVVGESGVGKSAVVRRLGESKYRLVWLTSDQLHAGRESAFESVLGLRHPFTEVVGSSPKRCLVVFDGAEGLSEPGLQLTARLVASLRTGKPGVCRVVFTVQPDGLSRLRAAFAAARVPTVSWEQVVVRPPGDASVGHLLSANPQLAWAALRPEFRALLRNLKVFDWVVRLQAGGGLRDTADLGKLTELIDRIWSHFVESGADGLARATLLKRIAAREADHMVQGLPMTECGADALAILPSSEAAGLVRRQDERVRFVHDMFADWARLKQLIEHDLPNSDATVRRAATAGWYRAVRLYAQRLLEQPGDGAGRWQRSVQALGSGGPEHAIVRDLFLEALVLSNDAAYLLTTVWQVLVAGDGELLALLIDRFRYVGTVADERALAGIENRAAAAQLEHLLRVPFEPYWYGVLPVLARHPDDLVRCALGPVAKLLRLWLSKVSPARRMTRPLRATAARLVLTIAREVQAREAESRMSVEDEVKTDCTSPCCGRPPNARTRSPSSASNWPTAGRSRNRCGSAARPPPRRTGGRWNAYPKPTRGPRGSSEPRPHWTRY